MKVCDDVKNYFDNLQNGSKCKKLIDYMQHNFTQGHVNLNYRFIGAQAQ